MATSPTSLIWCGIGGAPVALGLAPLDGVEGGTSPLFSGSLDLVLHPGNSGLDFVLSVTVTVAILNALFLYNAKLVGEVKECSFLCRASKISVSHFQKNGVA